MFKRSAGLGRSIVWQNGSLSRAAPPKDGKMSKKEAAARMQRVQAFEQAVKQVKVQPVKVERTPEELEEERRQAVEFSQKSLAEDRAKWYALKKFVEAKMMALNELPPHLRDQALMIDARPWPEQMTTPGLTPPLEPEWLDRPAPPSRIPGLALSPSDRARIVARSNRASAHSSH